MNKISAVILFGFISIALAACGSAPEIKTAPLVEESYRHAPIAEMSSDYLETALKDISVLCPKGWKETVDQKNAPNIALWIVREDYSASISFTPIRMDPALYNALKKDGVMSVAKASLSMKKDNVKDSIRVMQQPEKFRLNKKEFAAYEYSIDSGSTVIRVVIFDTGRQFFECALMPATSTITPAENRRLFEAQQSVLASLVLK